MNSPDHDLNPTRQLRILEDARAAASAELDSIGYLLGVKRVEEIPPTLAERLSAVLARMADLDHQIGAARAALIATLPTRPEDNPA